MDQRLIKALEASKNVDLLIRQQTYNFEKFEEKLVLYHNGGTFIASLDLVRNISLYISKDVEQCIFLDENNMPIQIQDLEKFYDLVWNTYQQALLEYKTDNDNILSTIRNKSVV